MTNEWVLPEDLSAAAAARVHVTDVLTAAGVSSEHVDDATLVASELAANAARHGRPPFSLQIRLFDDYVRITASNEGETPDPTILVADVQSGHGRGLPLVKSLSRTMGWARSGARLDVWAEVDARRYRPRG